ncbi:MAG: ribose-phosphate diphosphokinase [bacterium]|nr:ribose-phosphate diphosphokinase [bacterium]
MSDVKIFAGSAGTDFAKKLAKNLNTEVSPGLVEHFSEGNLLVKTEENVRHQKTIIVQTLWGENLSDNFLELLFWLDALKRADAAEITAIIPYFSYAKADKQEDTGVTSLRARVCADCLQVAGASRVITMDLHSPSIPGFFQIPVENLSARDVFCSYLQKTDLGNGIVVSPDAGFAKQARKYAAQLSLPCAIGDKNRPELNGLAEILEIVGEVKNKNCFIFDDFTTSAGTLVDVARALKERGAAKITAAVTHAPITAQALQRLNESPIEQLLVTNTTDNQAIFSQSEKIVVLDVTQEFARSL